VAEAMSFMIPKLIHQTYKTRDIPRKWLKYQRKVQALHPGWTYTLWTDEDNLKFVANEYPTFLGVFTKLPRNIMRADVIRYLLLHRLGGLYLDLDYEMLKPFDLLDHELLIPAEEDETDKQGKLRLCNAFMAATPGNAFFGRAIDDLKSNPPLAADADVEASTGPGFLTRVYRRVPKENVNVFIPAPPLFSPVTPVNPRQYRAIVRTGVSYGIHHTHGSWREFTPWIRMRRRVGNIVKWFT
jgi:mannosyltransferase OCH1-like enzyme